MFHILCSILHVPVCRIVSTNASEVVVFKADEDLKPGEVKWANYVKVKPRYSSTSTCTWYNILQYCAYNFIGFLGFVLVSLHDD